jgi:hypothetical protein
MDYDSTNILEQNNDSFYGFTIDNRNEIDSREIYRKIKKEIDSTLLIFDSEHIIEGNIIYIREKKFNDSIWYVSNIDKDGSTYLGESRDITLINISNGESMEVNCNEFGIFNTDKDYEEKDYNDELYIDKNYINKSKFEESYNKSIAFKEKSNSANSSGNLSYAIVSDSLLCEVADMEDEIVHIVM